MTLRLFARQILFPILFLLALAQPALSQVPGLPGGGASTTASEQQEAAMDAADRASLDDLIQILETQATRDRLIESLRSMAYQPSPGEAPASEMPEPERESVTLADSVPGALAAYTQQAIAAAQAGFERLVRVGTDVRELVSGTESINVPLVLNAMLPVLSVAIATFAAYFALSFVQRPILDLIAGKAKPGYPIRRLGLLILGIAVSVAKIFLAGAAGHVAALVFGSGPPNFNQALFLNAFVITGLLQVALSAFVAPYHPALRMTPFSDGQARFWYARLAFILILLGYTFLFIAPVVEVNSDVRAGNAIRFLVVLIAYLSISFFILRNREPVRERLQRSALAGATDFQSRVNYLLGPVWWIAALGFVTALFVLWLSSPRTGFQFMLIASVKSVIAIVIGGLVITILSRIIMSGIRIPTATKERFPLLERRINGFIPKLLFVLRVVVIAVVFLVILEAWSIAGFGGWMQTTFGQRVVGGGISALAVLCVAFAIYLVISSWVEYRLNPNFGSVPTARERTLLALFRNAFTIVLGVITLMLVLSQIGIDIAPLLAGAGVVGLAVGFGAQKLVQDIITGAFIQVENVMNEGDVVQIGATSGVVEKLTIRSVSLRALDGTYHLIPFSSVDQVANMTRDFSNFVADVEVAYRENTDEVKVAMEDAYHLLKESEQGVNIIDDFEFFGVQALGANSVTLRGRVRTLPGKQWGVGRLYNELIKKVLDERGIEIPFPQTTLWFGTGKDGSAPPLRLLRASAASQHAEIARSKTEVTPPEDGDRPAHLEVDVPETEVDDGPKA